MEIIGIFIILILAGKFLRFIFELFSTICFWLLEKIVDIIINSLRWLWPRFVEGMERIWQWLTRRIKDLFRNKNPQPEKETPRYKEEKAQQKHKKQQQKETNADPYTEALLLLGLPEAFTHKNFKKAYQRAMMSVHPDRGGTKEKAQAVNKARDVINKRKGW